MAFNLWIFFTYGIPSIGNSYGQSRTVPSLNAIGKSIDEEQLEPLAEIAPIEEINGMAKLKVISPCWDQGLSAYTITGLQRPSLRTIST